MSFQTPTGIPVLAGVDEMIILLFFFAGLLGAWWALAALKWDAFVNRPMSTQVQLLRFFLALIGGLVAVLVAILLLAAVQLLSALP